MNEQPATLTTVPPVIHGWFKLYHPRGPLVTFPLPAFDPDLALAAVDAYLAAGWLQTAPGLEEGEQRETVGYVVRTFQEKDGEVTPVILLYSADEGMKYSFLKIWLNTDADVAAFEFASKLKLNNLPEYEGKDKPERGQGPRLDKYFVAPPKPFQVVMAANPKYKQEDRERATKAGQLYPVPARKFARWVDVKPASDLPGAADGCGALSAGKPVDSKLQADASGRPTINGVPRLTPREAQDLAALLKRKNVTTDSVLSYYDIAYLAALPADKLATVTSHLEAKPDAPAR